jgi:hypothetical protein
VACTPPEASACAVDLVKGGRRPPDTTQWSLADQIDGTKATSSQTNELTGQAQFDPG